MNTANQLPAGFESLEPFVAQWAKETSQERIIARSEAPFEDIKRFYDAMVDKAEEALALVNEYPLDDIPDDVARLGRLSLALCQAAVAVEMHGQPRAPGAPYPNSIRLSKGLPPFG
jgi:hypothetical protein